MTSSSIVTIVYISIPDHNVNSTVSPNAAVIKECPEINISIDSTIACPLKYNHLTMIPNFLPDTNEIELFSEDTSYLDEFSKVFPKTKYKTRGSEHEALTAVQMALKMKDSLKYEKARKLLEHALTLQPLHPEVLNNYAEFLEESENDLITADHLYVKALLLCPNHSRALVNRNRTRPLVEMIDQTELERIDSKRTSLLTANHNQSMMKRIKKEVYFLHIHHTLAIEGNTMSLAETRSVVETKTAIPGKSIMEHNEILGLESALRYMSKTFVDQAESLNVFDILQIHKRVLGHVDPLSAGTFRRNQVFVGEYVPPPASEVEYLMEEFVVWFQSKSMLHFHPVKRAALAHYKLAHIHPFMDGNGRTARLLMNLILMRAGYPPVIIRKQDRSVYYNTLQMANEGDVRPFVRFIAHCTECTLDVFLNAGEYNSSCWSGKALQPKIGYQKDIISI
ncbi:protein adenylyltransferase Fic [Caerostris darwini]|uniref:Protein adenylyltransferase Fic n=1 Tax=Caerostris darwini TaxID=1538125 RepID=A0AAV4P9R3_9ARAC|nr:protein adenylyltransferase Fic [Caerostris darwini]